MRASIVSCLALSAIVGIFAACGANVAPTPTATVGRTAAPPIASAVTTSAPPTGTRHVVIDTDMAPDDWIAILYLLEREDVTVEAITVTGTGEAHCEPGVEHAGGLAALAGQPQIPVACGRETPLGSDHAFPDEWRQGVDALLGLDLPDGSASATDETATELLARVVEESAGPPTILALGPLTNIAEALQADPSFGGKVEGIYAMGGAVAVDGNVGISIGIDNRFAEWNIYADPHAARIVLESGLPVTLVPLDATNAVPISEAWVEELRAAAATGSADFVLDVLDVRMPFIRDGGYYFWDPFAAAVMVDEGLTTFESAPLTVETEEGPDSGRIVSVDGDKQIRFAQSANREVFERELIDTLTGR